MNLELGLKLLLCINKSLCGKKLFMFVKCMEMIKKLVNWPNNGLKLWGEKKLMKSSKNTIWWMLWLNIYATKMSLKKLSKLLNKTLCIKFLMFIWKKLTIWKMEEDTKKLKKISLKLDNPKKLFICMNILMILFLLCKLQDNTNLKMLLKFICLKLRVISNKEITKKLRLPIWMPENQKMLFKCTLMFKTSLKLKELL